MKRLALLVTMSTFMVLYHGESHLCHADNDVPPIMSWPDAAPIYNSYYDYLDGCLYVFSGETSSTIEVKVKHNGVLVLADAILPQSSVTKYNFNNCESGEYNVTISSNSIILTTFSFIK